LKINRDNLSFRHVLFYYFDLKQTAAKAHRLLSEVMKLHRKEYVVWFERFRNGDFDVRDKKRPGQPKKFEDFELRELLDDNSAQTLFSCQKHYSKGRLKTLASWERCIRKGYG